MREGTLHLTRGPATDRFSFGDWEIEIDRVLTKEYYDNLHEECACAFCVNYRMNCSLIDNKSLEFFKILWIDPTKEGEFMELGEVAEGKRHTGFYHVFTMALGRQT